MPYREKKCEKVQHGGVKRVVSNPSLFQPLFPLSLSFLLCRRVCVSRYTLCILCMHCVYSECITEVGVLALGQINPRPGDGK